MTETAHVAAKHTVAPFFRFDLRTGWPLGPSESRPAFPYDDRPLALAIAGRSAIPLAEPFGSFGGRTLPRGMAISPEGRIFLADPERRVILIALSVQAGDPPPEDAPETWPFLPLWAARPLPEPEGEHDLGPVSRPDDPYTLIRPVDLAFAPNGDLAVVDAGAARVLVLSWPSARLRHLIDFLPGTPSAIAFDRSGRAHVTDPEAGTVYRFDRLWRRDPDYPRAQLSAPSDVAAADTGPICGCDGICACSCPSQDPCGALPEPHAVIHLLDRGALVSLDAGGRRIEVNEGDLRLIPPSLKQSESSLLYDDPANAGHDPIAINGLALRPDGRHLGSGLPIIALPRRVEVPRFGSFTTTALDSNRTGFAWDRITLEAEFPTTTRVVVSTLTSEVEIAFDRLRTIPDERWSRPLAIEPGNLPEVLIQSGSGRHLWIRIEMFGDGTVSPSISAINVHGPRRSALSYLPASFHQDPESVRFLDRYLSYFDTIFAEITAANREIAALFDPEVTPSDFLSWLGAWFDLDFLASWSEETRREIISEAISYYRMRGTVQGLKQILQWHTGLAEPMPQVIEHFRLPTDTPIVVGGQVLDPGSPAHAFTIVLPAHLASPGDDRLVLERLIAASIPAHTRYQIRAFEPRIAVAQQSTIGVDMLIGDLAGALGDGQLGLTLPLSGPEPDALVHLPQITRPHPTDGGPPC